MKKKSIWQEILDRGIWVLIFLIGLVLSQLPLILSALLSAKQFPLLQSGLLVALLSVAILTVFIFSARKTEIATFNLSFFQGKRSGPLGFELFGYFNK